MRLLSVLAICIGAYAPAEAATLTSFSSLSSTHSSLPRLVGYDSANGRTQSLAGPGYVNTTAAAGQGRSLGSESRGDLKRGAIDMSGFAVVDGDTFSMNVSSFRLDATFTTDRAARITYDVGYAGSWDRVESRNGALSIRIGLYSGWSGRSWFADGGILTGLSRGEVDEHVRLSHVVRPGVTYSMQILIDASMNGGIGYQSGKFAIESLIGLGASNGARITFDDPRLFADAPVPPPAPVPLPPAAALLGAGLLGFAAVRPRRKRTGAPSLPG